MTQSSLSRIRLNAERVWAPPPDLLPSEWADQNYIVTEGPAKGPWRTSRTEYLREIMDCTMDPNIERVAVLKSSQVGITNLGMILIGRTIDIDPKDIIAVFPTGMGGAAEKWSKTRWSKMVRHCRPLREKLIEARDATNTILLKSYLGGNLILAGSNSPDQLSSNPCPFVLLEERARIAANAGDEGDGAEIAIARASLFGDDRLIFGGGSPTIKGECPSERDFLLGDQRYYHIPCYECGRMQVIGLSSHFRWDKDADGRGMPETAWIECEQCGARWTEVHRDRAVKKGIWVPTEKTEKWASFFIWQGYSPFVTFSEIVDKFLKAKRGGKETLQPFVNTVLGETWEEENSSVELDSVISRREAYGVDPIPEAVALLTCGVDVQEDRIEAEVLGWSRDEQTYSIEYRVLWGPPSEPHVWKDLVDLLRTRYNHPSGAVLRIKRVFVDSGDQTLEVYKFCKGKAPLVYPIKGEGGMGKPAVRPGKTLQQYRTRLMILGVDALKDRLMMRLNVEDPEGHGYCRFPQRYSETYFSQLTAEKRVTTTDRNGRPQKVWRNPGKKRNEPLDCRIYAMGARESLGVETEQLNKLVDALQEGRAQSRPQQTNQRRVRSKGRWQASR